MPRLENWFISQRDSSTGELPNEWSIPELVYMCSHGAVYGSQNPRFPDGKRIRTGPIQDYNPETEEFITESSTHYVLREVDPEYEKMYPNSKQRLINSIRREHEASKS